MMDVINNIVSSYEIHAKALNVLMTNTQKALEQAKREEKANEQAQRVEEFLKDLIRDLNNMLTKLYFLKDRKNRRQERMSDKQARAIAEFVVFVKTLTKNLCSLLQRFPAGESFQGPIDKEIKELEANVGQRLRAFDAALDETNSTLTVRLISCAQKIVGMITKLIRLRRIFLAVPNSKKSDRSLKKSTRNTEQDPPTPIEDTGYYQLENLFNCSSITSIKSDGKRPKCRVHSEA